MSTVSPTAAASDAGRTLEAHRPAAARGWLLAPIGTEPIAIGEFELTHVMTGSPELFRVPGAPAYCRYAVIWNNRPVPLLDLATRIHSPRVLLAATRTREFAKAHIAVVRFAAPRNEQGAEEQSSGVDAVEYGALALHALPARIEVRDDQGTDLPADREDWRPYALSCFEHSDGTSVPIVYLERLFSSAPDD